MRPLLPVLLAIAALAAIPACALAKGAPSAAQVCGADGCDTVDVSSLPALAGGVPARPPAQRAPFFTLRTTIDRGDAGVVRVDYLPSLGLTHPSGARHDRQWVEVSPNDRAMLDHVVAPFEPYPAARLALGTRPAHDADATPWLAIAVAAAAALTLLALLARYATSALKARPRASKSAN
jgi:hypothetical protein